MVVDSSVTTLDGFANFPLLVRKQERGASKDWKETRSLEVKEDGDNDNLLLARRLHLEWRIMELAKAVRLCANQDKGMNQDLQACVFPNLPNIWIHPQKMNMMEGEIQIVNYEMMLKCIFLINFLWMHMTEMILYNIMTYFC